MNGSTILKKFKYLGVTYTIDEHIYHQCIKRHQLRRLFSQADSNDPNPRNLYFHIISDNSTFFCAYSKNKTIRYNGIKHKTYKNLSKMQCEYLKKLAHKQCRDFREAITLTREAVESIYEIS